MEGMLKECKENILKYDKIEENAALDTNQFCERQRWREQAYELSNNIEIKWQQRSRCNWLAQGDSNTRFFHSYASARSRKNAIKSIEVQGVQITEQEQIQLAFQQHLRDTMGTETGNLRFEVSAIYGQDHVVLTHLDVEFSEREVEEAVKQLANNKAVGPDGVPHEYVKKFRNIMKGDIMQIFNEFYQHRGDLVSINRPNVVLIPKKENASVLSDYRPISVINIIPKLITKVLANRLRRSLPDLVSTKQTAFVKN